MSKKGIISLTSVILSIIGLVSLGWYQCNLFQKILKDIHWNLCDPEEQE